QKYLCSNCNNVLKKALQMLCGHRYCSACLSWILRNNKNAICQKCKEEDPSTLSEGSLLAEERAFGDAAINKEISELQVHCVTLGCSWSGIMRHFEEHQSLCEYALIPCHTGCGHVVMRKKLADHLENGCVNNVTTCQKCQRSLSSSEYQQAGWRRKPELCERSPSSFLFSENCSAPLINKDGCRFSEVGCSFRVSETAVLREVSALCMTQPLVWPTFVFRAVGLDVNISSRKQRNSTHVQAMHLRTQYHSITVLQGWKGPLKSSSPTYNPTLTSTHHLNHGTECLIRSPLKHLQELHRCLTQKDAGLSSLHKSLLFSEQASYDGVFLWKITDVGRKLQDSVTGRTVSLYSPAFYTAKYGYKVCLRVYLNGDGTGKGTHMSLFFVVMKGDYDALLPWPFRHKVTFMLLDQNHREHIIDAFRPDLTSASFQRPVNDMNVASGCPMFLPLSKLQSPKYAYVKEDTLFLKCIIETN
ncbi:TRAF2 factor, partial [Crotophaga sulcirostris]|nr:TRAF2 factor [Crotophaga sulcirostris]